MKKKSNATKVHLQGLPGHYIRRLHQIAVAIFLQETEAHGVTSPSACRSSSSRSS